LPKREGPAKIAVAEFEPPKTIQGELMPNSVKEDHVVEPDEHKEEKKEAEKTPEEEKKIDRKNKFLEVFDEIDNLNKKIEYDKLVLATGSIAKNLPVFTPGLKNVFSFKSISDLVAVRKFIYSHKPLNAIVIGSGYLGLEIAEALKENDLNVTLVDVENLPMPSAESIFSKKILEILNKNEIKFVGAAVEIESFIKNDSVISIKVDGRYYKSDLIISAIGFEPNSFLAKDAKLITGKSGGIKTDSKQRTNDQNIFAAGDSSEVINAVTGQSEFIPLAGHAYQQGHIAGENAAGGNLTFNSVVKNISVKIFDKFYCAVGLSSEDAKLHDIVAESVIDEFYNLVKVYPGSKKILVSLTIEKNNGRILGGQFFGESEVSGYADILSTLIKLKQNVEILEKINFNYTPPLSPFYNPLNMIGRIIIKKK